MTLLVASVLLATPLQASQVDLVLWITVDQLRGDMPWRFRDRFGDGGFRYLMESGSSYTNAHLKHASTLTAVGHAALATGGTVAAHGMAGNDWFDRSLGREVNCVEDSRFGQSPLRLTSSTFADELVMASGKRARVFSASIKDRAAIIMGGRLGKAFWFETESGRFVSSPYYFDDRPDWLNRWNAENNSDELQGSTWDLLHERDSYLFADQDDRWYEKSAENLGRTFPHLVQNKDRIAFNGALKHTPLSDVLLLRFVQTLFKEYRPGLAGQTDMLAISFSATDYVGHAFGPNSLEAEDNLLRLDRTLAELFRFIDQQIGLDKTLVVLSADHGVSPIPEHMAAQGFTAGRFEPAQFTEQLNGTLRARYGTEKNLVRAFSKPGIYLDRKAIDSLGLDRAEVEDRVAAEIVKVEGFTHAYTRSDLMRGNIPDSQIAQSVAAAFHPLHSGDVIVVQNAFWHLSGEPHGDSATHGSPHNYDTHVPIMLAGPGIPRRVIHRTVAPRDIAVTLSRWFGIEAPSGSVGKPLLEVFGPTRAD